MTGTSTTQFALALIIWLGFVGSAVIFVIAGHMVYSAVRDWWTDGRIKPPVR